MQNNYYQYGQLSGNQYPACNNQQGYQYINQPNNMQNNYIQNWQSNYNVQQNNQINNNQINNFEKDDSSSRDQYYNDHVACIVFGDKEFKEKYEKTAKEKNKTLDELAGTDFSFGKYLNFETNEKEWQAQLEDLKQQLSSKNSKFTNLKGIKFFLDDHGGKDRNLEGFLKANPPYYKSKRFQQVAKIINDCFLDKNQDNKLYFVNKACYGAYFFNELKKNVGNDVPRSNNIYEILSNTFGENRTRVYCSQLIPEIGIHMNMTMNKNANPYRNNVSLAKDSIGLPNKREPFIVTNACRNFIKKYYYEYTKLKEGKIITAPDCKIYFPLERFRDIVPEYLTKPINKTTNNEQPYINQEKYYKVDDETLKSYSGEKAKKRKNKFLKWGEQPKYVKVDETSPIDIYGVIYNNLSEYAKKNLYDYYQQCNEQFKQSHEKNQAIIERYDSQLLNSNSNNQANDCSIF